jgi:hypothetical protein
MQEARMESTGTLIAVKHGQMKGRRNQLRRRCMMNKNSALLSIGAALLFSLFYIDVGHAFQIDRRQDVRSANAAEMTGTANFPATQVAMTPNPCTQSGKGRTGAPGKNRCPLEAGEPSTTQSIFTTQVSNSPYPCGGRTGAPCNKQSPQGSGPTAIDRSVDISPSLLVTLPAAGILFGAGLTALVGLGARRLRHHNGPHDGHHA